MKKTYLIYGGLMGVLLLLMQMLHYKVMIRDVRIEVFGGLIAILFLGVGVWLGLQFLKVKEASKVNREKAKAQQLSDREIEVLQLLAQGHSNQQIADQLFVSLNTIKTHISKIYQKLNVSKRTQAVQKALEMAIISSPEQVN